MPHLREGLKDPTYIGDAVYAAKDDYGQIWLFTSNGLEYSNYICIGHHEFMALLRYTQSVWPGLGA